MSEINFLRYSTAPTNESEIPPPAKVSRRWGLRAVTGALLATALGVACWRQSPAIIDLYDDVLGPDSETEQRPPALMFVLDGDNGLTRQQGQAAASMLVREWCDKHGIEYRRYQHNADLFQETSWCREMQSFGREFGVPCIVVVDRDGRGKTTTIPPGVEPTLRLLELVFNVSE
jgi:hypothetical protein